MSQSQDDATKFSLCFEQENPYVYHCCLLISRVPLIDENLMRDFSANHLTQLYMPFHYYCSLQLSA